MTSRLLRALALALSLLLITVSVAIGTGGERSTIVFIKKIDRHTHQPLAGAVFEIRDSQGVLLATTDPTNEWGRTCVTFEGSNDGIKYTVTEVVAPQGYLLDPTPRTTNGDDDRGAQCDDLQESPDLKIKNTAFDPVTPPVAPPVEPSPEPECVPVPGNLCVPFDDIPSPSPSPSVGPGLPDTAMGG